MHVQHAMRAGPLVQVVDVLGDDEQVVAEHGLEPREGEMRRVRLGERHGVASRVVEVLHGVGIALERLGGRDVFDAMALPQPAGVAKRGHSALG